MSAEAIAQPLHCILQIPRVYSIHYFEFKNDFVYEGEQHDYWELVYADRGTAIVTAGTKELPLHQGEIIFHRPGEFHALRADRNDPPSVFIVCFPCRSEAMNAFDGRHFSVPTPLRHYIGEILSDGQDAFLLNHDSPYAVNMEKQTNAPIGCEQLIKANLELFLIKLLRFGTQVGMKPPETDALDALTERMMHYINNNLYGKIGVEDLCRELGFSRAYLSAHFKKGCGKTITEYVTEQKIKEAKYLIRKNRYTVAQISDYLRYDNPHYFCRVFKKVTQMTPKEYKNSVAYTEREETPLANEQKA